MNQTQLIIFSSLISGVLGVIITLYIQNRYERYKFKRDILLQLMGNRFDRTGHLFYQALNSIIFAFHDDKETVQKLKAFDNALQSNNSTLRDQCLLELIIAMLKNLKMKTPLVTDNFYLKIYYPKSKS